MTGAVVDVVVPTVGRPSLSRLLDGLAAAPPPGAVVLVDDRVRGGGLETRIPTALRDRTRVVRGAGHGPAAARNTGWRATTAPWVAFLDDDVEVGEGWTAALLADLEEQPADVAASQGRLHVPLPDDRRPTDWERNVAGLETARWATADMVYRRAALEAADGFDERFTRAYREDADLALRLVDAGWRIVTGTRTATHPVRPADAWVSVRLQAGNADDPLMRALHGPGWRERAGVPAGRRPRHLATTAAGAAAIAALAAGRPRLARAAASAWLAGTTELAWARIAPGPRTPPELGAMAATSTVLPLAATGHWLRGLWRARTAVPRPPAAAPPAAAPPAAAPPATAGSTATPPADERSPVAAVLFDRDDTLVVDVAYNGDPERVRPMPGARAALDRLRAAGIPCAVVSNQSGVARGLLTMTQVTAVNRRVDELLGPFDGWFVCPHGPDEGCACRKPEPGLVVAAARSLGVDPADCVVIGDIGADVDAARAAGARSVLVPTGRTLPEEVAAAPLVADDLTEAVGLLLDGVPRAAGGVAP